MLQSTSQNEKKKNVVKEENPDYQHFLLFQQIILKIIKTWDCGIKGTCKTRPIWRMVTNYRIDNVLKSVTAVNST